MTIIVTGAAGFVGEAVVKKLQGQGKPVVALDFAFKPEKKLSGVRYVEGNLADAAIRQKAFGVGCTGLIHLASVPGGAAEQNPALSRAVNVDATLDLFEEAISKVKCPRIVFASSIAAIGDAMPADGVDDSTPLSPTLVYGAHKAMVEIALATMARRGEVEGVSLRLPGILARPKGPSGLKSAFMSDVFHAARNRETFVSPVSADATMWLMSVDKCAENLVRGLSVDSTILPASYSCTLPAIRATMGELVEAIIETTGADKEAFMYAAVPDTSLQSAFGSYPPLSTPAADRAGFEHDVTLFKLVESALRTISS